MDEKGKEILMQSAELFTKYGIKSMTMDDVARHLGISKKTLYLYVSNKKDLVKKCIEGHIGAEECMVSDCLGEMDNAIDELMAMTKFVGSQMKEMHPSVIYDLKKYHFEAYKTLTSHRDEFIFNNIKNNIEKGIKSGLYRDNMNPEIIARFYISMVNLILDPSNSEVSNYNISEIHIEMIRYHIRGIASSKGREYLKQKFKQDNI